MVCSEFFVCWIIVEPKDVLFVFDLVVFETFVKFLTIYLCCWEIVINRLEVSISKFLVDLAELRYPNVDGLGQILNEMGLFELIKFAERLNHK